MFEIVNKLFPIDPMEVCMGGISFSRLCRQSSRCYSEFLVDVSDSLLASIGMCDSYYYSKRSIYKNNRYVRSIISCSSDVEIRVRHLMIELSRDISYFAWNPPEMI